MAQDIAQAALACTLHTAQFGRGVPWDYMNGVMNDDYNVIRIMIGIQLTIEED